MFARIAVTAVTLAFLATSAIADENVCPCLPLAPLWTVTACDTWNCAASALIIADGDPYVVTLPTTDTKYKWVVLRRTVSGSVLIPADNPFRVDQYDEFPVGSARFQGLDKNLAPMMITASDGKVLVISLSDSESKSRARSAMH